MDLKEQLEKIKGDFVSENEEVLQLNLKSDVQDNSTAVCIREPQEENASLKVSEKNPPTSACVNRVRAVMAAVTISCGELASGSPTFVRLPAETDEGPRTGTRGPALKGAVGPASRGH